MFRLSKGAEYAIRALVYIAGKKNADVAYVEEIAVARGIPRAYLSKLLQNLARKGLLKSYRGQEGGFALARQARDITLLEIIEAIEGQICFNECLVGNGICDREELWPGHDIWKECLNKFTKTLGSYSIASVAERELVLRKKRLKRPE